MKKVKAISGILCILIISSIINLKCLGNELLIQAKTDGIRDNLLRINRLSEDIVKLAVNKGDKPSNNNINMLIKSLDLKYLVKSFKIGEYDLGGDVLIKYTIKFKDDSKTLFNESLLKLVNGELYKKNKRCSDVISTMTSSDIKMVKEYEENQSSFNQNGSKITAYDKQKLSQLLMDFKNGKVGFSEINRVIQQEIAKGNVIRYRLRSSPMIILSNGEQLN